MTRWKSEKGLSSSYRSLISPGQNILNVEFSPRGLHLVSQMVKSLPAMRETQVQSLGWEDPLEKEIAIHSSILAWKIPWMEEPGRLQSIGLEELDTTSQLNNNHHPKIYHLSHFNSVDLSTSHCCANSLQGPFLSAKRNSTGIRQLCLSANPSPTFYFLPL